MNVLVVGSGGREHAIVWRLSKSPQVKKIYCAPGNVGMQRIAELVPLKSDNVSGLLKFAKEHAVDLTVVGPEYPLTLGIVDEFRAAGLTIFGPTKYGANLEASKNFAKEVMLAARVPTADYAVCTSREDLIAHINSHKAPLVLKADGLAAGKGVFVCSTDKEALAAVEPLFGELKAEKVLVEEFLSGVEASLIVATDGETIVPLAPAHDYKRIFDKHQGPNTGGMGTVSPTSHLSESQEFWVIEHIIQPVVREMARRSEPYSGFLYAGLMIGSDGKVHVIEFNARLGDPETQVIMRRMASDLYELLHYLAVPKKSRGARIPEVRWTNDSAICVVLASEGYPGTPKMGDEIVGINLAESLPGVVVFHAGTALNEQKKLVTAGGRVLNVTAIGENLRRARELAYKGADMIQYRGRQARRDIGLD